MAWHSLREKRCLDSENHSKPKSLSDNGVTLLESHKVSGTHFSATCSCAGNSIFSRKSQSSSTLFISFCCHCDLKSTSIKEVSSENCFEVFTDFALVNAFCYKVKTWYGHAPPLSSPAPAVSPAAAPAEFHSPCSAERCAPCVYASLLCTSAAGSPDASLSSAGLPEVWLDQYCPLLSKK